MAKRQKKKKQNITLDDLKQETGTNKKNPDELNIVEKSKEKNVTLDDIINNEEGIINNEEGTINNEEEKINNEEWTINNEEWTINSEEGIINNEEEKINNEEWRINNEEETINNEEWRINNEEETINNEEESEKTVEPTGDSENENLWDDTDNNKNNLSNINNEESSNASSEDDKNSNNEGQKENNFNDKDWNKWKIALDNLGDHINSEETNTINVNDEKYNVAPQSNTDGEGADDQEWLNTAALNQASTIWLNSENNGWEWNGEWLDLWEINIDGVWDDIWLNLDLSGWSLYDIQKAPRVRTWKATVLSALVSIISLWIWVLAYFYNDFITHDLSNIEENRAYTFVETAKDFISKYKKWDDTDNIKSINLIGKNWEHELDNLINWNLNYIQKKQILDEAVTNLSNNIISKYSKLNDIRSDITRYGFFPKDLANIISESEPISSIQNSLIALEAIKFSSAISVFSYLDTFTTSLVQSLWIDRKEVEEKIWKVTSRWESDINIYIKNCYLNPFEWDYDCDYIWDFNEYYKNLNDDFDTQFFKELIKYTDSRLEQSEIPSFAISFKEFNQADNEITFDIEINTLKEDEAELTKKWILSPHIFILNSLINSLRQSRFIVWDDISVKTLNVTPNTYIIWMSEINVNRSVNTFTVHIKKENAVEIDDFVYMDY